MVFLAAFCLAYVQKVWVRRTSVCLLVVAVSILSWRMHNVWNILQDINVYEVIKDRPWERVHGHLGTAVGENLELLGQLDVVMLAGCCVGMGVITGLLIRNDRNKLIWKICGGVCVVLFCWQLHLEMLHVRKYVIVLQSDTMDWTLEWRKQFRQSHHQQMKLVNGIMSPHVTNEVSVIEDKKDQLPQTKNTHQ